MKKGAGSGFASLVYLTSRGKSSDRCVSDIKSDSLIARTEVNSWARDATALLEGTDCPVMRAKPANTLLSIIAVSSGLRESEPSRSKNAKSMRILSTHEALA